MADVWRMQSPERRRLGDPVGLAVLGIGLGAAAAACAVLAGAPVRLALALAVLVPWGADLLLVAGLLATAVLRRQPEQPRLVRPRSEIDLSHGVRLPLPRQDRQPLDEARKRPGGPP